MQSVVELVLEMPGELGMIEVAGVDWKHVGVDRNGRVLHINQDFDRSVVVAGGKGEQGMIVEAQVVEHFLEGVGHGIIVIRS